MSLGATTYYVGVLGHNDHQWIPFGVFAASSLKDARRISTPDTAQIYDLMVRDGRLYALSNTKRAEDRFDVEVLQLREAGDGFEALFGFEAPTFARSFELLAGDCLGSEMKISFEYTRRATEMSTPLDWCERLSPATGEVWRVRGG